MRKYLLTAFFIILFAVMFPMVFSAREYTVPQAATPPTVDGKTTTKFEWYGAYHLFMNYEKGYDWLGCVIEGTPITNLVQDRENACKGYDVYIMWYGDPNESGEVLDIQHGGLYFRVVAQDKSRGYSYSDGGGQNDGDCVMLSIDPFYYRATSDDGIFSYAFSYYSSPETRGPPTNYEYNQFECKVSESLGVYSSSKISADGYDLEFFISWTALNLNDRLPRHKVGSKMGLGIALLDSIQKSPFYLAIDYGGGADPFSITPRRLNTMIFGNTVYPPDYIAAGDVTALRTLAQKARDLNKNEYTTATYSALEKALATVDTITQVNSQTEIDAAKATLQKAFDELITVNASAFDKLKATIATASALIETDYTPETWQPFFVALEGAKAVNPDSSDGLITAADNSLTAAMLSLLEPGKERQKADISALTAVINSSEFITEQELSAENWEKLQTLLEQARLLTYENSQFEIDNMAAQLNEIIAQKIEVSTPESEPANNLQPQNNGWVIWLIVGLGVLLVAGGAVTAFFIIRRKNKRSSEELK